MKTEPFLNCEDKDIFAEDSNIDDPIKRNQHPKVFAQIRGDLGRAKEKIELLSEKYDFEKALEGEHSLKDCGVDLSYLSLQLHRMQSSITWYLIVNDHE